MARHAALTTCHMILPDSRAPWPSDAVLGTLGLFQWILVPHLSCPSCF